MKNRGCTPSVKSAHSFPRLSFLTKSADVGPCGRVTSVYGESHMGKADTSVGALLTGFAQNLAMFVAGRFLTGLGCTLAASSA